MNHFLTTNCSGVAVFCNDEINTEIIFQKIYACKRDG